MGTTRPPTTGPDARPTAATRARRLIDRPLARTAVGLAVLAAIVGGLVAYERLSGDGDAGDRLVDVPGGGLMLATEEPGVGALDGRAPEVGRPAPEFALRDPAGELHRLSDYRGSVVWINFWATWCVPCKRELPAIQRLYDSLRDRGLVVLAVNLQQDGDRALAFWEDLDLSLPLLLDRTGAVYDQYRLRGLPDSFFVDRDGIVRGVQFGFLTEDQMQDKLAEAGLQPTASN